MRKWKSIANYILYITLIVSLVTIIIDNNRNIVLDTPFVSNGEICAKAYYKKPTNDPKTSNWIVKDIEKYDKNDDENGTGIMMLELAPGNKIALNEEKKLVLSAEYTDTIIPLYQDDLEKWKEKLNLNQPGDEYIVSEYINFSDMKPLKITIIPSEKVVGIYESCKEINAEN